MNRNALVVLALALSLTSSVRGQTQGPPKYKTMTAALDALGHTSDEAEKSKIYGDMGRLPFDTPEQVLALYEEVAAMEGRVKSPDQKQYVGATQYLTRTFSTATDPKFSGALATVLAKEYASMPKDFIGPYGAKQEVDVPRYEMRMARLKALTEAVGISKNREALPTLRKMVESNGIARDFAVAAIGQIGDPADLEDFIKRIERDPKAHFNLNSFGPAAVDRIVQEIDKPSVPDAGKGVLISGLRYMGTRENRAAFRQLLNHKEGSVQRMAAAAICSTATKDDGDILIEITRSNWGANRLLAVRALSKNWDAKFIPVLRNILLHDDSPIVRAETAQILATHKVVEAIPDLKKVLNDREGEVRRAAAAALKNLQ